MRALQKLYLAIAVSLIAGCSSAHKSTSNVVQKSSAPTASKSAEALVPASSETTDWVNVASSEDGMLADFDSKSVKYSGSLVAYRLRLSLPRANESGISMYGAEQLMDCESGAYQDMRVLGFNEQGTVVFDKQDGLDSPVQENKVGSPQDYIHKYICKASEPPLVFNPQLQRAYEERIRENQQFVSELTKLYSSNDDPCDYPWQSDAIGQQCGNRAASERLGGR